MQLRYPDDDLHRIASDAAYEPVGWDAVEVAHFRLVVQCADAAVADTDLLILRLLRLPASAGGHGAVVILSDIRLLTITFETDSTPMTAVFGVSTRGTDKR